MSEKIQFEEFGLPIPENIHSYSIEQQKSIYDYLNQMNDFERKAYVIAFHHLGTSFNILKSTGYIGWKKAQK